MATKKTILILSLIILIASICGTAMAATQAQIEAADENGVAWLAAQQTLPSGYWEGAGPTGLALVKLQERVFELGYTPFDPCYPYKQNVEKGLAYLFSQMSVISISSQPYGNPDTDGDGNGVSVSASTYNTGIALMAIAASRAPDREVNSPGSPVNGWTYKEVLQDMVDYMAFGQCDSGSGRGGWGYSHNGGSDNSNSGYAVSGLGFAESPRYGFNCIIPQFVKDELKIWIDYIQTDGGDDDGGSGYTNPNSMVNLLKTGNLIFQMKFVGRSFDDPNVQRALNYLGLTWNDPSQDPGWGNPAYGGTPHCQAMYCTTNGLQYSGIYTIIVDSNERDWYADFADALVNAQQSGGYWPADPYGGNVLATAWALLTLEMPTSGPLPTSLELTKVDDVNNGDCVGPGREITYTIDYNYPNDSNIGDINDVNIIDHLPNEVNYVSSDPCGFYDSNSHTVTWNIGTLHPGDGGSVTLKVNVKPCVVPGSTIRNECGIRSGSVPLRTAYEYTSVCCWRGTVIYVDANAPDCNSCYKGASWQCPYKYLQDALEYASISSCVKEIWVAAGTYKPDCNSAEPNGSGDQTATFSLINNVAIYGGFPPGGGAWETRDPNAHKTILSGDIGTPDVNTDNSYHVVTGSGTNETAVLDGFTITGGNANGDSPYNAGGGIYNNSGSPTITNCTFSGNSSSYDGGGMYNNDNSSPIVTNCTFSGNSAYFGGGMYNAGNATIINCIFSGNWAYGYFFVYGGGMVNDGNATITNCTFNDNSAYCEYGGLENSGGYGGGISNWYNATITNCTFSGNSAYGNNGTYGYGGGICCYSYGAGTTKIANCILYNDTALSDGNEIALVWGDIADVNYSDVEGGQADVYVGPDCTLIWGPNNTDADPCFVSPPGNLRLLSGSPCIDAGDNNSVPPDYADLDGDGNTTEPTPLDLDGRWRIADGNGCCVVDMGAYEFPSSCFPCTDPKYAQWLLQGKPYAWCCLHQRDGDATGDGQVTVSDLGILKSCYGSVYGNPGPPAYNCKADFTHDGQVTVSDLGRLKSNYGTDFGSACPADWKDDCGPNP